MKFLKYALAAVLCPALALAQEGDKSVVDTTQNKVNTLQEVVLYANRLQDPVMNTERNEYLKQVVQPANVADLFAGFNGFSLVKRGNYAIDPAFRASQYEQLNIQFDGGTKVMHACPNRMDPITTHVVPESIERIEVIKGPFSVRYGSSFAGIINLVSKEVDRSVTGFHGTAGTGSESNGNSMVNTLRLQQTGKKFDFTLDGSYREFGDYEDGNGNVIPSAFRSLDYGLSAGYMVSENDYLRLHWRQSFGRDVMHAGLPMDTEEDNSTVVSLDYSGKNDTGLIRERHGKVYFSYVDHIMTNKGRPSFMMTEGLSEVEASTFGGKYELTMQPAAGLKVFSGIDALMIYRDGGRNRTVKRNMQGDLLPMPMEFYDKVWQDGYVNDLGVFTETKWVFSPRWVFRAGARMDMVYSDVRDVAADFAELYPDLDRRNEFNVSATASLKYKMAEGLVGELAVGRGVRSANMVERYVNHFTIGQDPYEYVGNPQLDAEVNNQVELGIQGDHKMNTPWMEGIRYGVSGYYSRYQDYIVGVIDPDLSRKYMPMAMPQEVKRFTNLDKAYKYGFEAEFGWAFTEQLELNSSMAWIYTRNEDLGESLPLTPPLRARLQLKYNGEKLWWSAEQHLVSSQDDIAPSFGEQYTPGYQTTDLRLGFTFWKNVSLGMAAINVFDEYYSDHLNFSFVNQGDFSRVPVTDPGRNLSLFMQWSF